MSKYEEWRDYPSDGYEREPYEVGYDDAYNCYPSDPSQFEYDSDVNEYLDGYEDGEIARIDYYGH